MKKTEFILDYTHSHGKGWYPITSDGFINLNIKPFRSLKAIGARGGKVRHLGPRRAILIAPNL